jgi:hypothetical protein
MPGMERPFMPGIPVPEGKEVSAFVCRMAVIEYPYSDPGLTPAACLILLSLCPRIL